MFNLLELKMHSALGKILLVSGSIPAFTATFHVLAVLVLNIMRGGFLGAHQYLECRYLDTFIE